MVKKRRIAHQTSLKSILKEEDDDDNDNGTGTIIEYYRD